MVRLLISGQDRSENQTFSLHLFNEFMVKRSFTALQQQILLQLPKSFIGKRVEILAYTEEEVQKERPQQRPLINFNTMKVSTKGFHFNRDEANER